MPDLSISHEARGESLILRLEGVFRPAAAEDFDAEISKVVLVGPRTLVLDLARLEFVGSAGIGALIRLNKAMRKQETRVHIANANQQIQGLFRQSRLDEVFPFFDSLDTALT